MPSAPKPAPVIGAVCADCGGYEIPYYEGIRCPGCNKPAKKRSLYICTLPNHCDSESFFTYADLLEHQEDERV